MKPAQNLAVLMIVVLSCVIVACSRAGSRKTVSFTLYQDLGAAPKKPEAEEEIAIFPLDGEEIRISEDNRLGIGKTDSQGHATIEFRTSTKSSKYVLLEYWRKNGAYVMLRHNDSALAFECDGSKPACDLGDLVFETFVLKMSR